jgi:ribosomal protein S18 acetylase RimI-like enzyme
MASTERTLSFRPVAEDDLEFLFRVYAGTRAEELAVVPWPAEQKEIFLRQQFNAQHQFYREHYPNASFEVVLLDGEPVGRLYVDRWTREHRIVDVALLPEHRGGGVGTRLLRHVIEEATAAGKSVSIHVEVYNPARRLYDRLGFVQVADRGVHVLMERPLTAGPGAVSSASGGAGPGRASAL